jgi:hypothetical protein
MDECEVSDLALILRRQHLAGSASGKKRRQKQNPSKKHSLMLGIPT